MAFAIWPMVMMLPCSIGPCDEERGHGGPDAGSPDERRRLIMALVGLVNQFSIALYHAIRLPQY